jgi:DNA-binding response OmpR family regulator
MNIVVIEDDKDVIDVIKYFLEKEQFRVHVASDGLSGLELTSKVLPNLILLDLVLPKLDGIEVCRRLKADKQLRHIPLIMVTAKGQLAEKIDGLEVGADDYVTKPFSPHELMARVRAKIRRHEGSTNKTNYQYGPIFMDVLKHEVRYDGTNIDLTAKEFELLHYFLENQGRILTRDMILNHVWGYDHFGSNRSVDVYINHLRRKLPLLSESLTAIRTLGYKLKEYDWN